MPRDSGESIFAARHPDVSQGPLGIDGGHSLDVETWKKSPLASSLKDPNPLSSEGPRLEGPESPFLKLEGPFMRQFPGSSECRFVLSLKGQFRDKCI